MDNGELQRLFHKAFRTSLKKVKRKLHSFGVFKGQLDILEYLAINNGCIQKDLADFCNLEPATITSVLATMEKNNFIERIPNLNDRRVLNVFLTKEGKEIQKQARAVIEEAEDISFRGFSEEEKLEFEGYLNRILKNNQEEDNV